MKNKPMGNAEAAAVRLAQEDAVAELRKALPETVGRLVLSGALAGVCSSTSPEAAAELRRHLVDLALGLDGGNVLDGVVETAFGLGRKLGEPAV